MFRNPFKPYLKTGAEVDSEARWNKRVKQEQDRFEEWREKWNSVYGDEFPLNEGEEWPTDFNGEVSTDEYLLLFQGLTPKEGFLAPHIYRYLKSQKAIHEVEKDLADTKQALEDLRAEVEEFKKDLKSK